jgi:chitin disaccharide deacetylase
MPSPNARRLVVNADDLGLAASVNRGIVEAIESGVVRSTSLMVNMAACDDAIARLRDAPPAADLGVGLHFNIVAGRPLTGCHTLLDSSGDFLSLGTVALKAYTGGLADSDVALELNAQLDRAESLLSGIGRRITHIDSHRHAHCLPRVYEIVVRAASDRGIPHVRHPYERRALMGKPLPRFASGILRMALSRRVPMDDVTFAGFGAMGSRSFEADVLELLAALPAGTTELMVHPGHDSPELAAIDPYRAPRERELRALTSPLLRQRISELGIQLTHFGSPSTTPAA